MSASLVGSEMCIRDRFRRRRQSRASPGGGGSGSGRMALEQAAETLPDTSLGLGLKFWPSRSAT
eukprot:12568119-Alexandrium_andersonii.AAC.1